MNILKLLFLGLAFGSFVNAFVYRLYTNDKHSYYQNRKSKNKKKSRKNLSIWNGRSICVHCKHQLNALDLIPVLSWVMLMGKCRYCHKNISWQYPIVELVTTTLFIISYIYWPESFNNFQAGLFAFWCIFLIGFMALVVFDLRWYLLPDKIVYGLYFVYIGQLLYMLGFKGITNIGLLGIILGSLTIYGFFWILFQVSQGKWIGGGDVKLGLLLGALAGGVVESLLIIFIASLLGSIIGGVYLFISKRLKLKAQLPFGPYLMAATILVVLFGTSIINLYKSLIGY